MESYEDSNPSSERLQIEEPPQIDYTSSVQSVDETEEILVQKFENVAIEDHSDFGALRFPLRPYAGDCPFYLKTATCKFGFNCRFNHPVRNASQVGSELEKEKEDTVEKLGQNECKYYLRPGGCKNGESCKYSHLKDESEIVHPELNFLGLPIRLGQKECSFYMRNGSCGYGDRCRFNHPDPTASGGSPQVDQVSWSSHMTTDRTVPFQDNWSSNASVIHSLPQGAHQDFKQNMYQAPNYAEERIMYPRPTLSTSYMKNTNSTVMQVDEYPERPGQPECDYFIKTGECKFKSACKYNHPKSRIGKADICVLNEKGLPLRPGKKICWHYEQNGMCKYGRDCLFDHPNNNSNNRTFPIGSMAQPQSTPYGILGAGTGYGRDAAAVHGLIY